MLQQVMRVGSIILIISTCLSAMERPTLKQLATKKVANLIVRNSSLGYCNKTLDVLPNESIDSVIQQVWVASQDKGIILKLLSIYRLYRQQQPNIKHYQLRLACSNDKQLQLTPEQSGELMQASAAIRNLVQDFEEQVEEVPLPLLTQEQVTYLLPYLSVINALNTSNSTLPILQQERHEIAPGVIALPLPYSWIKCRSIQQLKEYLTACTIPMLYNLIMVASYLGIESNEQTINFIELATHALGDKLLQSIKYQDEYTLINTLPDTIQHTLVHYLIDNSTIRYALCSNSTNVISNTAQILTGHTDALSQISSGKSMGFGSKYVVGTDGNTVIIWSAITRTCIQTLNGHTNCVNFVELSPNDKYIASSSSDNTIKIWDAVTGICIHTLICDTNFFNSFSWSPDSDQLRMSFNDRTVKVWDIVNKDHMNYLKNNLSCEQVLLLVYIINAHDNQQDIDFAQDTIQERYDAIIV